MSDIEERGFKGIWIPREIWLDTRLNALDKIILAEIDSLDASPQGCYASNKHLAEFCQCSETKVSNAISKLIKLDYIYVQSFDGRKRELKSRLTNFKEQPYKNCKAESQNLRESNIDNNIDNNKDIYISIVEYLNKKAGTDYRYTTKKTQALIKARLKEKFTKEDFYTVIDNMCSKWLTDEKMKQYLRPETLFGTKFEGYLNIKPKQTASKPDLSNMTDEEALKWAYEQELKKYSK